MKGNDIVARYALWLALALPGAALAQDSVRIGHLGITPDGPFYIALEKGYFKEAGIEVKFEPFVSAVDAMAPLSAGQIEVAGGAIGPSLYNGFARGLPLRIVAHRTRDVPGNSADLIMLRSDLKARVKSPADLKGMTIAINAPGAPHHYMVDKLLQQARLSLKDVKLVYMPWPDMGTAFTNKVIDGGGVVEPFPAFFEQKGVAYTAWRASDAVKDPWFEVAVIFYNDDWAKKNPRVANEFMVAYVKASRDLMEAWNGGRNRGEIIDILIKHTRVKERALYDRMHWSHVDLNGAILRQSLIDQQEYWAQQGQVPKKVDVDKVIDERYVKYAVGKLGARK
jgi:NitT/TauT family transport system substrate-binding protein